MKPVFVYLPTTDLTGTARFYRDQLGLDEAWREGDDTIAFAIPGSDLQLMVSTDPGDHAMMYLVPSVAEWISAHPTIEIIRPSQEISGGIVVGFTDPAGNPFYIFDQE
jgi:predicted enzyme related to lactoylglutathione lyase